MARPTEHLQDHHQPNPTPTRRPGRYTLRPPGETLQSISNSKHSLAEITVSYPMNGFTLIKNCEELSTACATLERSEAIGVDCETTDLDPYKGRHRLTQLSNDDHTFIIDHDHFQAGCGYEPLKRLLETPRPRSISHNGKFDQKWLQHSFGIQLNGLFDTMLASILLDYTPGTHKLESVAKTYLGIEVDKTLQKSNWSGELSHEQLTYAARDSQILVRLRQALIKKLREQDLFQVAQLEFEAVPAFASIELNGIYLDTERWQEQLTSVKAKHATLSAILQEMLSVGAPQGTLFGPTNINLDAHPQILAALKQMNVPLDRSTKNNILLPLAKDFPVVATLLEYRPLSKALTSYGEGWFDAINQKTGRVHPDFTQIGAPTGRSSCSDPNVQQVPHAVEYRRCFRAPEGRKFCIVDYSQIELRIVAEMSSDPGFLAAFQSGADLHRLTAAQVFNVAPDKVEPQQRDFAKRLNFGVIYGIGAQRYSNMTGMSLTDAENTLRRYFQTYQVLDTHLRDAAAQALKDREVRTLGGRVVRYKYDPNDKQQVSETRRQARNAPIQGTGADIFKRSLHLIHNDLRGTSAQIVNIIHDEVIVEVDAQDAEEISQRISSLMIKAGKEYIKNVPITAEPQITDEWVKD